MCFGRPWPPSARSKPPRSSAKPADGASSPARPAALLHRRHTRTESVTGTGEATASPRPEILQRRQKDDTLLLMRVGAGDDGGAGLGLAAVAWQVRHTGRDIEEVASLDRHILA